MPQIHWSLFFHAFQTNRSSLNQIQMSFSSGTRKRSCPTINTTTHTRSETYFCGFNYVQIFSYGSLREQYLEFYVLELHACSYMGMMLLFCLDEAYVWLQCLIFMLLCVTRIFLIMLGLDNRQESKMSLSPYQGFTVHILKLQVIHVSNPFPMVSGELYN